MHVLDQELAATVVQCTSQDVPAAQSIGRRAMMHHGMGGKTDLTPGPLKSQANLALFAGRQNLSAPSQTGPEPADRLGGICAQREVGAVGISGIAEAHRLIARLVGVERFVQPVVPPPRPGLVPLDSYRPAHNARPIAALERLDHRLKPARISNGVGVDEGHDRCAGLAQSAVAGVRQAEPLLSIHLQPLAVDHLQVRPKAAGTVRAGVVDHQDFVVAAGESLFHDARNGISKNGCIIVRADRYRNLNAGRFCAAVFRHCAGSTGEVNLFLARAATLCESFDP